MSCSNYISKPLFSAAAPLLPVLTWVSQDPSDTVDFTLAFYTRFYVPFYAWIILQYESNYSLDYIRRKNKTFMLLVVLIQANHCRKLEENSLPNLCTCTPASHSSIITAMLCTVILSRFTMPQYFTRIKS